jgi:hypothetical protein
MLILSDQRIRFSTLPLSWDRRCFLPWRPKPNEAEIRKAMAARGVDGVLVITLTGDTGAQQQYAGTITTGNPSAVGTTMYGGGMATTSMSASGTSVSTPVYRFSRAIAFEARLSDPQTSRKFWVGGDIPIQVVAASSARYPHVSTVPVGSLFGIGAG